MCSSDLYDSLPTADQRFKMEKLAVLLDKYLADTNIPLKEWEFRTVQPPDIPAQDDCVNCGLFVCALMDCMSQNQAPDGYGTFMMDSFRFHLLELLRRCRSNAHPAVLRKI